MYFSLHHLLLIYRFAVNFYTILRFLLCTGSIQTMCAAHSAVSVQGKPCMPLVNCLSTRFGERVGIFTFQEIPLPLEFSIPYFLKYIVLEETTERYRGGPQTCPRNFL